MAVAAMPCGTGIMWDASHAASSAQLKYDPSRQPLMLFRRSVTAPVASPAARPETRTTVS
eukprot:12300960-Alexandrium_andersonii.AAC.1